MRVAAGYIVPPEEFSKVERLYERYGVASEAGKDQPHAPAVDLQ